MSNILITGGNGSIAKQLIPYLESKGHSIKILTTKKSNKETSQKSFLWNINTGFIEQGAFKPIDVIIHLSGANVGKRRWTERYKREIYDSRINSSKLLWNKFKDILPHVKTFISMSGIGIYPDPCKKEMDEYSLTGKGFMSKVCIDWEKEAQNFKEIGSRVLILRTAPVLTRNDGLLKAYLMTHFFRIIPTLGNKKNYLSWIHIDDLIQIIGEGVENPNYSGVINATAPFPALQSEFVELIDKESNKRSWHPNIPAFVLKWVLGEKATLPLTNQKVVPTKLKTLGYVFRYPQMKSALQNLLGSPKNEY